jgi:hypothetical protein
MLILSIGIACTAFGQLNPRVKTLSATQSVSTDTSKALNSSVQKFASPVKFLDTFEFQKSGLFDKSVAFQDTATFTNVTVFNKNIYLYNPATDLSSPAIRFMQKNSSEGGSTDSASITMIETPFGVRTISLDRPLRLAQITSNNLSGQASLLDMSGDTLIYKGQSNTIIRINGVGATSGQALTWNGSAYVPQTIAGGQGGSSGNGVRAKLSDGSVNIYPDTVLLFNVRNFKLATTGNGQEAAINTTQNIATTDTVTFGGLTVNGPVILRDNSVGNNVRIGSGASVAAGAVVIGTSSSAGTNATNIGNFNTVSGTTAVGVGNGLSVSGSGAVGLGSNTAVTGINALVGGLAATSSGLRAVAWGAESRADYDSSSAWGYGAVSDAKKHMMMGTIRDTVVLPSGKFIAGTTRVDLNSYYSPTFQNVSINNPSFSGATLLTTTSGDRLQISNTGGIIFSIGDSPISIFHGTFTQLLQSNGLTANRGIILPDASGTFVVSASAPFSVSATGNLSVNGTIVTSLNSLTAPVQTFSVGSTGTSPNIASSGSNHAFNFPLAGSTITNGGISNAFQAIYGDKNFLDIVQTSVRHLSTMVSTSQIINVDANSEIYRLNPSTSNWDQTVNLPAITGATNGRPYTIIRYTGNSSTRTVTIVPSGTDKIEGKTSIVLSRDYDFMTIINDFSVMGWKVLGGQVGGVAYSNTIFGGMITDSLMVPAGTDSIFKSVTGMVAGGWIVCSMSEPATSSLTPNGVPNIVMQTDGYFIKTYSPQSVGVHFNVMYKRNW